MSLLVLTFAPTVQDQLHRLALWTVMERFPDANIPSVLARLLPSIEPATALRLYGDLVEAVTREYQWETGELDWSEIVPDAGESCDPEAEANRAVDVAVKLALGDLMAAAESAGRRAA